MSRTLARTISIGILALCIGSVVAGGVIEGLMHDRVPVDTIVQLGDPSTPGMQEVLEELQRRIAQGDHLSAGGDTNIGIVAVVLLEALGGTLQISSAPGEGTTIIGRTPVQATEARG